MHTNNELYDNAEKALVQKYMFEDFLISIFITFSIKLTFKKVRTFKFPICSNA